MTKKMNWAQPKHYAQVRTHLIKQDLDENNLGYYSEILGTNGLDVYMVDLKGWLDVQNTSKEKLTLEIKV